MMDNDLTLASSLAKTTEKAACRSLEGPMTLAFASGSVLLRARIRRRRCCVHAKSTRKLCVASTV